MQEAPTICKGYMQGYMHDIIKDKTLYTGLRATRRWPGLLLCAARRWPGLLLCAARLVVLVDFITFVITGFEQKGYMQVYARSSPYMQRVYARVYA